MTEQSGSVPAAQPSNVNMEERAAPPPTAASGVGSANESARTSGELADREDAQRRLESGDTSGKVEARAINQIQHDGTTIPPGKRFRGDAKEVLPLIAAGAAEHYPPRQANSPQAKSEAILKQREEAAKASGKQSTLELQDDEVPSTGTPQAAQAAGIREQVASDAARREARGSNSAPVTDNFGRVVPADHADKVADASAEISRNTAKQAEAATKK